MPLVIILIVVFLLWIAINSTVEPENVRPAFGSWNDVKPRSAFGGNRFEFEEFKPFQGSTGEIEPWRFDWYFGLNR